MLGLAVLFAYLFLVGLYESWSMPAAVLMSVTIGVLGAMSALWIVGLLSKTFISDHGETIGVGGKCGKRVEGKAKGKS